MLGAAAKQLSKSRPFLKPNPGARLRSAAPLIRPTIDPDTYTPHIRTKSTYLIFYIHTIWVRALPEVSTECAQQTAWPGSA
jgi:hypothetical protein